MVLVLWISGIAAAESSPETYPQRIVSVSPSVTEALFVLGVEDRIKAVSIYCNRPEAAKKKERIGTVVNFNLERVLTLKTDLIFTTEFADPKSLNRLKKFGIRIERIESPKNFKELCNGFIQLGKLVGREKKAEVIINKAKKELDIIVKRIEGLPKPRVLFQLGARPLFVSTKESFTNDLTEYAGGINITADSDNGNFSREEILKRNPEVIIIVTMGIAGEKEKQIWQSYDAIDAVKNNRVFIVDADKFCRPNPITYIEALEQLIDLLHPDMANRKKSTGKFKK
jgi:iron complex transport system substrate-binding protein